ncbi:MAG: glycoside hydrolase family 15 protein [Clostridium sp.]
MLKENLLRVLRNLRNDKGLYLASTGEWYQKIWVRDNFYESMPELYLNRDNYKETYQSLLDYYINIENKYRKFTWLIDQPEPKYGFRFPHPRMTPDLDEIREEWGFKQLDCFGEFLYGLWLGEREGIKIIRGNEDIHIINLMIRMLEAIEYWNCKDNAIWEENEEVHASSVGACLAGLTAIRLLGFDVNQKLLDEAHYALNKLLPRESETKDVDLALLTLIYPFNIVSPQVAKQIITNVEADLVRERGVIRYKNDQYYNQSGEAEWCFGFTFLALAYKTLGNMDKAKYYLKMAKERTVLNECEVPELFMSKTSEANGNSPLGWSNAMLILAIEEIEENLSIHKIL